MTHRTSLRPSVATAAIASTLALAAGALAMPLAADAHTSVYTSQTKTAVGTPPTLVDGPVHYLVSNHGHNVVLREDNGVTTGGALNYKVLPSAWRSTVSKTTLLATATGAQPHATCSGVAALDEAAVLAWQESDPFYAYVPWQKTAAGLGDDEEVAKWIAVVKDRTGVDLATVADPAAACASVGGTYVKADATQTTGAALSAGDIALVSDPLAAQIEAYKKQVEAAKIASDGAVAGEAAKTAAATTRATTAETALAAANAPLGISLAAKSITGKSAGTGIATNVTGRPNQKVLVVASVTTKERRKAKLRSVVLADGAATLDASGKATVTLKPSKSTATALRKVKGSLTIGVGVTSADVATASTKLAN